MRGKISGVVIRQVQWDLTMSAQTIVLRGESRNWWGIADRAVWVPLLASLDKPWRIPVRLAMRDALEKLVTVTSGPSLRGVGGKIIRALSPKGEQHDKA
jgi:hypothetical protein